MKLTLLPRDTWETNKQTTTTNTAPAVKVWGLTVTPVSSVGVSGNSVGGYQLAAPLICREPVPGLPVGP